MPSEPAVHQSRVACAADGGSAGRVTHGRERWAKAALRRLCRLACGSSLLGLALTAVGATLPSTVEIEQQPWSIVTAKKLVVGGEEYNGYTYCLAHKIVVRQNDERSMGAVLLHELMHAVGCEGGRAHNEKLGKNEGNDHPAIYFLAPRLFAVLADNPDLLKFLHECRREEPEMALPLERLPH